MLIAFHDSFLSTKWEELAMSADSWRFGAAGLDNCSPSRAPQAEQTSAAPTSSAVLLDVRLPSAGADGEHGMVSAHWPCDCLHIPEQVSHAPP